MTYSIDTVIAASYARRHSVEQLDDAVAQLSEAFMTSGFTNLNVLGMSVGQDKEQAAVLLKTIEAARQMRLELDDTTGGAAAIALDARAAMGTGFDFSLTRIE